jgi:hypothetical protein
VRNIFLPPTSSKKFEDILEEKWYKILLEALQNLYKAIPRANVAVLEAKGDPTPY